MKRLLFMALFVVLTSCGGSCKQDIDIPKVYSPGDSSANCMLLFTIITHDASTETNTMPRSWDMIRFNTEKDCISANLHRKDFGKWHEFRDEQGLKKSKSECVCF